MTAAALAGACLLAVALCSWLGWAFFYAAHEFDE
jgi:hypothetical protein